MKKLNIFLIIITVIAVSACAFSYKVLDKGILIPNESRSSAFGPVVMMSLTDYYQGDVPSSYDLRDEGRVSEARDQGLLGACWAFSCTAALESVFLPQVAYDFSEDNFIYNNAYDVPDSGLGTGTMATSYLASWRGPILEEDDPYADGYSTNQIDALYHVQEMIFPEDKDYTVIKSLIYNYGPVVSNIYIAHNDEGYLDSDYFDSVTYSYYYNGNEQANHQVLIIGYDDNYSALNFSGTPSMNGAFICMNSWGDTFGEEGVFYVSYEDMEIGTGCTCFTKVEAADNYDKLYEYDELGYVANIGYDYNSAYMANVFKSEGYETLEAVSFYSLGAGTSYNVYVCENYEDESSLTACTEEGHVLASGVLANVGYYTIDLDEEISLDSGEEFAVIVMINTPGTGTPIAIETKTGDDTTVTYTNANEKSYISKYGKNWEKTQDEKEATVCLKAFTNDK